MANITFGVNLIPKNSDNTQQTLGNSENKWNIYANNLTATTINSKTPVSGVKGNSESSYRTGDVNITAANIGLGNVENKSSATIRGELTKANVTTALGYTPPTTDTNTWRGIQDNLTSTSTSDSLSANQGKVLKGLVDGKAASGHTHTTSIATSTGTNQLTLAANTKYAITAGGTSYIFTTPPDNNTDTKVTSAANHYTPSRDTNADKSASASGATAAWSIDVVKGVTVQTDGKGHVTGVAVTSGKIPGNPNTDTHRAIQVNGTQALGNNTTALNLKAGSNVTITDGGSGAITIAATDTNTWRPVSDSVSSTSSSDAASSKAVKTAYDLAASKTANTGTVTSVATGVGLTGGTITGSGTLKAKLRSETALTIDSAAATTTSGRVYPVAIDKTGYLAVNVPWTDNNTWRGIQDNLTSSSTSDSLSANQGKLLKNAVDKCEVLVLSKTGVSSLNTTFENSAIETDMVCIKAELSNPVAQASDWTVDTGTAGRATISGSINGSTDIKIYLMKSR